MPLLLLFYLILTTLPPWPQPLWGLSQAGSGALMAAFTALPTAAAWWLARRTRRRLVAEPFSRREILHRYGKGKLFQLYGLMACHLLGLTLGWGWAAPVLCWIPPFAELLQMAPFLIGLVLAWAAYYPTERAIQETGSPWAEVPPESRLSYVVFLARQHLAIAGVPLALVLAQQGVVRTVPELLNTGWFLPVLLTVVMLSLVLAPWALKVILGLKPLPAGPLRAQLEVAGRRLGVRYAEILQWDTRNGVANAMVAGVVPWVRYVLLSDRLIDELTPAEIEAVFGHEAGHVQHGHMVFYLLFFALSLAALNGLWVAAAEAIWGPPAPVQVAAAPLDPAVDAVDEAAGSWRGWEPVPSVLLAGAYVFVAFGFVSRRCERQADLYGCRAVSCTRPHCDEHGSTVELPPAGRGLCDTGIRTFVSALEKVAAVNGISRDRPGWLHAWMHGSIARRVAFLEGVLTNRALAADFQRRVGLLKWGLVAALGAALVGLEMTGYGSRVWAGM